MTAHDAYSDLDIASFVLGIDMGERSRLIQARLAQDDAAAARALKWEAYFLSIVDGLPASQPPDEVLSAIRQSLGMQDGPILGDARQARAAAQVPDDSSAQPRGLSFRPQRKHWILAAGAVVVLALGGLLISASLHQPQEAVVSESVTLQPQQ